MDSVNSSFLPVISWVVFYGIGDFRRALPLFVKLDMRYPGTKGYKFYAGICYLQKTDEQEKAIGYLEAAYSGNPKLPDILFFLGRAYMLNYRFDEAIGYFKLAEEKKKTSSENRTRIPLLIEQCMNAKELRNLSTDQKIVLENIGAPVNTEYDEYVPLVSTDESIMIFTYKGKRSRGGLINIYGEPDPDGQYFEDIFAAHLLDNEWLEPDGLGPRINSSYHDAAVGLAPDGHSLFISNDEKGGDIYISRRTKNNWGAPEPIMGEVNTKNYEGHASISVNKQVLFFVSDRPGGFGGQDIYQATLQEDNTWGNIVNLGPDINTPYDEDAPFIHANGKLLFFSSEGHNSMGGFDVFYTTLEDGQWSKPDNLGPPVNTPNDDNYYVVSPNGEHAYFSSGRAGGYGGQDIYMAKPGVVGELPDLALIKGSVQNNGRNVQASIKVTNTTTNEIYHTNTSDVVSDNYLISLLPGHAYQMDFMLKDKILHTEKVDVSNLNVFVEVREDIELSERRNPFIDSTNLVQTLLDDKIAEIEAANQVADLERMIQDSIATALIDTAVIVPADTTPPPLNGQAGEAARLQVEVQARQTAMNDSLIRAEEEARLEVEETARLKAVEEARLMDAQDSTDGAEEEARMKAEKEARLEVEETARLKAVEEARLMDAQDSADGAEEEARMKAEKEARLQAEEQARQAAIKDSLTRAEAEARLKAENAETERVEKELRLKAEEEARRKTEETARLEAEAVVAALAASRLKEETAAKAPAAQGGKEQLNFSNILFDFDKATLRTKSKKELDEVQLYLTQNSTAQMVIAGHADAIGTEKYNMKLSERRAQKAAAYLIDQGVSESQLVLYAFGKSKPISANTNSDGSDNPIGRQKNRRVEFAGAEASKNFAGGKTIAFSRRVANQSKQITGSSARRGTFYNVQVAAYKYPQNYKHESLDGLGEVIALDVDGITRFTLGRYDNLKEARQFKKLIVKMGTTDAFITAEVDGERKYLNEMNNNGGLATGNSPQSISPAARVAYKRVMARFGDERAEGLEFTVQIAAYEHAENYSTGNLKTPGDINPKLLEDAITRFTIGSFETLREAEQFKKSVLNKGTNLAFVTAKYNGERVLVKDLIANNFYTL